MTRFVLAAVALLGAAGPLGAQVSAPNISAPKRAAMNAAAATNAHTNAMTSPGGAGTTAGAPLVQTRQRQTPASSPAPRSAAAPATTAAATRADSGRTVAVGSRGAKGEVTFTREAFAYDADARRDPFFSLLRSNDLRPAINDLRLVTIIYDPTGRNSVAILRDLTTKDQYRVRVGQTLGRMRVSAIQPKQVNFVIEEFGFSRQESLALIDDNTARTK